MPAVSRDAHVVVKALEYAPLLSLATRTEILHHNHRFGIFLQPHWPSTEFFPLVREQALMVVAIPPSVERVFSEARPPFDYYMGVCTEDNFQTAILQGQLAAAQARRRVLLPVVPTT
jgi:hypothetical protein